MRTTPDAQHCVPCACACAAEEARDVAACLVQHVSLLCLYLTFGCQILLVPVAEEAGDVAAYLVPRIREVPPKSSTLTGGIASQYIQFLTKPKAYGQIISVSAAAVPVVAVVLCVLVDLSQKAASYCGVWF